MNETGIFKHVSVNLMLALGSYLGALALVIWQFHVNDIGKTINVYVVVAILSIAYFLCVFLIMQLYNDKREDEYRSKN